MHVCFDIKLTYFDGSASNKNLSKEKHLQYTSSYKTMANATGDRIRELEIMIKSIDIETVFTRTRHCLTVLDHIIRMAIV